MMDAAGIADHGWQDFYKGEIASRIVKHVQDLGGILTRQDLAREGRLKIVSNVAVAALD